MVSSVRVCQGILSRGWDEVRGVSRADSLKRAADLYEDRAPSLIARIIREPAAPGGDTELLSLSKESTE